MELVPNPKIVGIGLKKMKFEFFENLDSRFSENNFVLETIKIMIFSCFVFVHTSTNVLSHSCMFQGDITTYFCENFDPRSIFREQIMDFRLGDLR